MFYKENQMISYVKKDGRADGSSFYRLKRGFVLLLTRALRAARPS